MQKVTHLQPFNTFVILLLLSFYCAFANCTCVCFPGFDTRKEIYAFIAKGSNMVEFMKKSNIKGLSKSTQGKEIRSDTVQDLTTSRYGLETVPRGRTLRRWIRLLKYFRPVKTRKRDDTQRRHSS